MNVSSVIRFPDRKLVCEETKNGLYLETREPIRDVQGQSPLLSILRQLLRDGIKVTSERKTLRDGHGHSTQVIALLKIEHKEDVLRAKRYIRDRGIGKG